MTVQGASTDGVKLIGWGGIPVPLATTAIILRFLSRSHMKIVGVDDYSMLFALILYYGWYASLVVWVEIGWVGWPQNELDLKQVETFLKMLYGLVIPAIKLSILLLYRRIFLVIRPFILAVVTVAFLVILWCISVEMTVVFECIPVGSYWKLTKTRHCIDSQKFYWANGISNLLLDFIILCLPIPVIWQLHMTVRRKMSLIVLFMLGICVCVASIVRMIYIWKIDLEDVSGTIVQLTIWTSLEQGLGIVAGCLPTLPALARKWSSHERRANLGSWRLFSLSQSRHWLLSKIARHSDREVLPAPSVDGRQLVPANSRVEYSVDSRQVPPNVEMGEDPHQLKFGVVKVRQDVLVSTIETDQN